MSKHTVVPPTHFACCTAGIAPSVDLLPYSDPRALPDEFRLVRALLPYMDRIEVISLNSMLTARLVVSESSLYFKGTESWVLLTELLLEYVGVEGAECKS